MISPDKTFDQAGAGVTVQRWTAMTVSGHDGVAGEDGERHRSQP
jgi:hypothetical protein